MKKNKFVQLVTSDIEYDIPLSEYPRPQLKRNSYYCLNGIWDFKITTGEDFPSSFDEKIKVPYCVESYLSGINKEVKKNDILYYKKEFVVLEDLFNKKLIMHFDGIDSWCEIYMNGKKVISHEGGYLPFECDATSFLKPKGESNEMMIKVKDSLDHLYPYGKQKVKRGGMWYTPCSGIWKSVWYEIVALNYIQSVKIDTTLTSVKLLIHGGENHKKVMITTPNSTLNADFEGDYAEINIPDPVLWSPENPYLYFVKIISGEDEIESYFGLRTLSIKEYHSHKVFFLNDQPYFFNGLLDQGYYPDGNLTPRSYHEYERDILRMKELGFNMLRKHIKIEPLYFYYLCDKLGMIVFQDMVNNAEYRFFHDTVFPTFINDKANDKKAPVSKKEKDIFLTSMQDTISLLYNAPSICLWTIFNEGWGQFESERMYEELLKSDSSRFVDMASGWFDNNNVLNSKHIYFTKFSKVKYDGRPLYISEFGGYELSIKDHRFNPHKTYGYKHFTSQDSLQEGITSLYMDDVYPLMKEGLCALVYTQVSDVEDETNGLLTYDRKICKVNKEKMNEISSKFRF